MLRRIKGNCRYYLTIFLLLSNQTVRHWRFDKYSLSGFRRAIQGAGRADSRDTCEYLSAPPSIRQAKPPPIQPEAEPHLQANSIRLHGLCGMD